MPSASPPTSGSAIECLHEDVAASQPLTRRVGGRCCHGTRRIRGPPPCTPQGRRDGAASDALRDRCLNYLSYTHRLTTCRMPLWCLRCRAFWHLARDCKQPRILVSYASSGSGSRTALERRRARRLADQPLPAAHREPTRTTLSSTTASRCRPDIRWIGRWRARASSSAPPPLMTPKLDCGTLSRRWQRTQLSWSLRCINGVQEGAFMVVPFFSENFIVLCRSRDP